MSLPAVRGFLQPQSSFSLEDGTPCCSWQSESIRFQAGNQVNLSRQQQRALTFPFRVLMCAIKNTYFLNENLRHSLFILWKIDGVSGSLTFLFLCQLDFFFVFVCFENCIFIASYIAVISRTLKLGRKHNDSYVKRKKEKNASKELPYNKSDPLEARS